MYLFGYFHGKVVFMLMIFVIVIPNYRNSPRALFFSFTCFMHVISRSILLDDV